MRFLILVLFPFITTAQIVLDNESIYICGCGSQSKIEMIAENFNLSNEFLTHISLGSVVNGSLELYEITPNGGQESKIRKLSWEEFRKDDCLYEAIWELKTLKDQQHRLISWLENMIYEKVTYDFQFDVNTDHEMYCSELVAKALNQLEFINFHPSKKKLLPKYRTVLNKDELLYYPVDFFIESHNFKLKYEQWNN